MKKLFIWIILFVCAVTPFITIGLIDEGSIYISIGYFTNLLALIGIVYCGAYFAVQEELAKERKENQKLITKFTKSY